MGAEWRLKTKSEIIVYAMYLDWARRKKRKFKMFTNSDLQMRNLRYYHINMKILLNKKENICQKIGEKQDNQYHKHTRTPNIT